MYVRNSAHRQGNGCEGICHCSNHSIIYLNCFKIRCAEWQVGIMGHQNHVDFIHVGVIVITNINGISVFLSSISVMVPASLLNITWILLRVLGHWWCWMNGIEHANVWCVNIFYILLVRYWMWFTSSSGALPALMQMSSSSQIHH